jgi:hypothetical protein
MRRICKFSSRSQESYADNDLGWLFVPLYFTALSRSYEVLSAPYDNGAGTDEMHDCCALQPEKGLHDHRE